MNLFLHSLPTWFILVSLSFCIGTLVCRLWVLGPKTQDDRPDHAKLFARLWSFLELNIAVIAVCSIADLLGRTAEMSGNSVRTAMPLLPAVIMKTHFGKVWLIRMAALALFAISMRSGKKYRDRQMFLSLLLFIGAVIAFTHSATGHAADSGDFSVAELADLLHLAGSLVWAGGLFVLSLVVLPDMVTAGNLAARPLAAAAAARFSRIAGIVVGSIVITSLYNAWIYVGSLEALFGSPYGKTIIAKIVLFILLLVLAVFNRYISVPYLHEWAGQAIVSQSAFRRVIVSLVTLAVRTPKGDLIASRFLRTMKIEAFLMLGLLLCVAMLRHEVPARHHAHLEHTQAAGNHGTHEHEGHEHRTGVGPETVVRLETDTAEIIAGAPVSMKIHLEDADKKPLQGLLIHHDRILHAVIIGKDLNVFAHIHPEDVGPITDEMLKKATFPLRFTFPKAGEYMIGLDFATEDGHYSKRVSLSVSGRPRMSEPKIDISTKKDFGPYHVTLKTSPSNIKLNTETLLRFIIRKNNKPVTDLEPYLGAPMHLAIVRMDLSEFIHGHGFVPGALHSHAEHLHTNSSERYGPEVDASIVFPARGVYKIFSEVQHGGKTLLFDFMVEVK